MDHSWLWLIWVPGWTICSFGFHCLRRRFRLCKGWFWLASFWDHSFVYCWLRRLKMIQPSAWRLIIEILSGIRSHTLFFITNLLSFLLNDWWRYMSIIFLLEELHLAEEHLTVVRVDKDLKDVLQDMRNHLAWRVVLLAQLWIRMIQLGMHRLARVLAKLTGKIGELAVDWIRMLRYQVQIRLFA